MCAGLKESGSRHRGGRAMARAIGMSAAWWLVGWAAAARASEAVALEVGPRPLGRIAPGTVIGESAPEGWTHLVIKSVPRLDAEEKAKVAGLVAKLATSFSTVIVARVTAPLNAPPLLGEVALGLAAPIAGRDVVVTAEKSDELGADLGIVGNLVLGQAENRLDQVQTKVRGRDFLVFDVPGLVALGQTHADMVLRYALVVEPESGQLRSFFWLMDVGQQQELRLDPLRCRELAPNTVEDCRLQVDASAILAGVPGPRAFAVVDWPPGPDYRLGEGFRSWLVTNDYTPQTAAELRRQVLGLAARTRVPEAGR